MSHEDLKSSAHVWGDGDENRASTTPPPQPSQSETVPSEAPPAYTTARDSNAASSSRSLSQPTQPSNPLTQLASLASIPFPQYQILSSTQSSDHVTLTTTHPPFFTRPEALINLLTQQALLPPKPTLHITGTHENGAGSTVTDFDISLSLLSLLNTSTPPTAYPTRLRVSDPPRSTPSPSASKLFKSSSSTATTTTQSPHLQTWARHFCHTDKSENRSLTLTRTILDFEALTSRLEGHIRTLLATLQYRGKVGVAFPVAYRDVVVHKRPGNWLAGFLRLYPEQRYEGVVEGVWELSGNGVGGGEGGGAKVAEGWWRDWEGPVREAVLGKRKGMVGVEDWVTWKMGERSEVRGGEWGVDRLGGAPSELLEDYNQQYEERTLRESYYLALQRISAKGFAAAFPSDWPEEPVEQHIQTERLQDGLGDPSSELSGLLLALSMEAQVYTYTAAELSGKLETIDEEDESEASAPPQRPYKKSATAPSKRGSAMRPSCVPNSTARCAESSPNAAGKPSATSCASC